MALRLLLLLFVVLVPWAGGAAAAQVLRLGDGSGALQLALDVGSGAYSLQLGGRGWLQSGDYAVGGCSAAAGCLQLQGWAQQGGADAGGAFVATTLQWRTAGGLAWHTAFVVYNATPAIAFRQTWPQGQPGVLGVAAAARAIVRRSSEEVLSIA